MTENKRFFTATLSDGALRQVAMVCMLIDHLAWAFLPSGSVPAGILHTFGRITAPVICFLLTEGYRHTHSFRKYLTRMMIFAAVSYFPYLFFLWTIAPGSVSPLSFNMLYTLSLSLAALWTEEHIRERDERALILALLLFLSLFGDWPIAAILFTLNFSKNRSRREKLIRSHLLIAAGFYLFSVWSSFSGGDGLVHALLANSFQLGTVLALPLVLSGNGKKGRVCKPRYFFYWFYPIHLLVLGALRLMIS